MSPQDLARIRRRILRKNATPAERVLWECLRNHRCAERRFRRQHSIGPFIVDFYCHSARLVVEVEGGVHNDPWRADYDYRRDRYLRSMGLRVIYFSNEDVIYATEAVFSAIAQHIVRTGS
ncbi:MAG: endonuclease domain-containing protein [Rhodothermales bacterium]|nr:endonuclease domain-containing protein [Rhodothermales bacterium]